VGAPTVPYKASLQKSLVGPAGEHHCLAQLLLRGYLATSAPPGTPEVDLLVLSPDGVTTAATIQVKTRTRGPDKGWHMNKKHEAIVSERLFYAFVDFEQPDTPVYVIPSRAVADILTRAHAAWLAAPGKNGKAHRDHDMRRMIPVLPFTIEGFPNGWMETYRNAWGQITETG